MPAPVIVGPGNRSTAGWSTGSKRSKKNFNISTVIPMGSITNMPAPKVRWKWSNGRPRGPRNFRRALLAVSWGKISFGGITRTYPSPR